MATNDEQFLARVKQHEQGWIMGIIRHVVADYYRQRERMSEFEVGEGVTATEGTETSHQAMPSNRKQHLMQAIQQLTDDLRDVVLLRFMEGFKKDGWL